MRYQFVCGRSPQLAIRLGFWARVLAFLFRALPLVVRVDAKHETHIQRTPVESGISAALFRSLCLHSRHTNILHTRSSPVRHRQATSTTGAKRRDRRRRARPSARIAKGKAHRRTGQGPSTPQALHLHLADMLADRLTGACVRSSCGESPEHRRNAHARRTHAGPRTHAPTHMPTHKRKRVLKKYWSEHIIEIAFL